MSKWLRDSFSLGKRQIEFFNLGLFIGEKIGQRLNEDMVIK
jgi:hypothetical protein